MPADTTDHEYPKPKPMRQIDLTPEKPDVETHPDRKKFWVQRRYGDSHVRIGFPEPTGFISREHDLDELIEALEDLRDFEPEEE